MGVKGFEDDYAMGVNADEQTGALELTAREKAIARGKDPDKEEESTDATAEAEAEDKEVAGKDAAASSPDDEEDETDDEAQSWVSDEVKKLAQKHGIGDDELESFENEKDFRRFASILEKTMAKADAKTAGAEKPAAAPAGEAQEVEAEDILDLKEFEELGYDEHTLKVVKAVSGLLGRIGQLESQLAAGSKQRELDTLHGEIDKLGGRFGKTGALTNAERKARERLLPAFELVKQSVTAAGDNASTAAMLRKAELVAFGDDVLAEEKAKQKEALSQSVKKQSAKRRSVGRNTKPPTQGRSGEARDPVKAIANNPAIVAFWNENQD
jgi:hypothetical protein